MKEFLINRVYKFYLEYFKKNFKLKEIELTVLGKILSEEIEHCDIITKKKIISDIIPILSKINKKASLLSDKEKIEFNVIAKRLNNIILGILVKDIKTKNKKISSSSDILSKEKNPEYNDTIFYFDEMAIPKKFNLEIIKRNDFNDSLKDKKTSSSTNILPLKPKNIETFIFDNSYKAIPKKFNLEIIKRNDFNEILKDKKTSSKLNILPLKPKNIETFIFDNSYKAIPKKFNSDSFTLSFSNSITIDSGYSPNKNVTILKENNNIIFIYGNNIKNKNHHVKNKELTYSENIYSNGDKKEKTIINTSTIKHIIRKLNSEFLKLEDLNLLESDISNQISIWSSDNLPSEIEDWDLSYSLDEIKALMNAKTREAIKNIHTKYNDVITINKFFELLEDQTSDQISIWSSDNLPSEIEDWDLSYSLDEIEFLMNDKTQEIVKSIYTKYNDSNIHNRVFELLESDYESDTDIWSTTGGPTDIIKIGLKYDPDEIMTPEDKLLVYFYKMKFFKNFKPQKLETGITLTVLDYSGNGSFNRGELIDGEPDPWIEVPPQEEGGINGLKSVTLTVNPNEEFELFVDTDAPIIKVDNLPNNISFDKKRSTVSGFIFSPSIQKFKVTCYDGSIYEVNIKCYESKNYFV